jgi:hypothetical protein
LDSCPEKLLADVLEAVATEPDETFSVDFGLWYRGRLFREVSWTYRLDIKWPSWRARVLPEHAEALDIDAHDLHRTFHLVVTRAKIRRVLASMGRLKLSRHIVDEEEQPFPPPDSPLEPDPQQKPETKTKPGRSKRARRDPGGSNFHALYDTAIQELQRYIHDRKVIRPTKRGAVKHLLDWLSLQELPEGVELPEDRTVRNWVTDNWLPDLPDK